MVQRDRGTTTEHVSEGEAERTSIRDSTDVHVAHSTKSRAAAAELNRFGRTLRRASNPGLADYPCPVSETDLQQLVVELSAAADAASARSPEAKVLGIRAVEVGPGRRHYLAAFAGPRFLCLDVNVEPVRSERDVREVAAAALLCERAIDEIDVPALHALAQAAGSVLAVSLGSPSVDGALGEVAAHALALAAWSAAPLREISSLAGIELATALHGSLRAAHADYLRATQPFAEAQIRLPKATIDRLRDIDERASAAGVSVPLSTRLAEWISDCDEGAAAIVAGHVTPLV